MGFFVGETHLHLPTANGRLKFLEEHVAGLRSEDVEGTRHPSQKIQIFQGWMVDGWMDGWIWHAKKQ